MNLGIIGKWMDQLTDTQRDRIIEAQSWAQGGSNTILSMGQGCVVEHAYDCVSMPIGRRTEYWRILGSRWNTVPYCFDDLCSYYGTPTVVQACKARAAAGNSPTEVEKSGTLLRRDARQQEDREQVRDEGQRPVGAS